jgi:hypothetical protein
MKMNKKAILGMLVAMVMSLGVMGGINTKSNDSNLQQVAVGCGVAAGYYGSEGNAAASSGFAVGAVIAGDLALTAFKGGAIFGWNPVGWGTLIAGGALAL